MTFYRFGSAAFGPHSFRLFRIYNGRRPHQSKDNLTLPAASGTAAKPKRPRAAKPELVESLPLSEVRCEKALGGLLKHYYRKAA